MEDISDFLSSLPEDLSHLSISPTICLRCRKTLAIVGFSNIFMEDKHAQELAALAQAVGVPAYLVVVPDPDDPRADVRKVYPESGLFLLTPEQFISVTRAITERHTCQEPL